MLSPRPRLAQSACLRCQLRLFIIGQEVRGSFSPAQKYRTYHSTPIRLQQESKDHESDREAPKETRRARVYRTYASGLKPERPPVQKPGTAKRLRIHSLGRPAEVILMKDGEQQGIKRRTREIVKTDGKQVVLSAEEIETAIANDGSDPDQDEVNASLDAMRPIEHILAEEEFNALSKTLVNSYTPRQLTHYFVQALPAAMATVEPKEDNKLVGDKNLPATEWAAGITPIKKRHSMWNHSKTKISRTRKSLADKIVRVIWGVRNELEEQQLGEIEVRLEPWQLSLMFDAAGNKMPTVDKFIGSPLLSRSSEIAADPSRGVIRITAKRQDAWEIRRRLEKEILATDYLELDLSVFQSLQKMLRRARDPKIDQSVPFLDDDMKYVSDSTGAVIKRVDNGLRIYHPKESVRYSARRLLLTLLDLPNPAESSTSKPPLLSRALHGEIAISTKPERSRLAFAEPHVHRRHRNVQLSRILSDGVSGDNQDIKSDIGIALNHSRELSSQKDDETSCWLSRPEEKALWITQFCLLTQRKSDSITERGKKIEDLEDSSPVSIIPVHQVPGTANLLSYFVPAEDLDSTNANGLSLVASFLPTPFDRSKGLEAMRSLPRVEIVFRMSRNLQSERPASRQLELLSVSAELDRVTAEVALESGNTDLRFTRSHFMDMRSNRLAESTAIHDFQTRLQESIASPTGFLDGMPEIEIPMPGWLFSQAKSTSTAPEEQGDVPVTYLLDRFEQIQDMDLVPLQDKEVRRIIDPALESVFDEWRPGMVLRRREVDAGAFGGKRTELALMQQNTNSTKDPRPDERGMLSILAVDVARLMARSNDGTLPGLLEMCPQFIERQQEESEPSRSSPTTAEASAA